MARIHLKTPREIELIRESGRIAAQTLQLLEKAISPGFKTLELDKMTEEFKQEIKSLLRLIRCHRAQPLPMLR